MWRFFWGLLSTALLLSLLLLSLLYFLLNTQAGLSTLTRIANDYAQDYLFIEHAEGYLGRDFTLTNVEIKLPEQKPVKIDSIALEWDYWQLWHRHVDVKALTVVGGDLEFISLVDKEATQLSEDELEVTPLQVPDIPLNVSINRLEIIGSELLLDDLHLTMNHLQMQDLSLINNILLVPDTGGDLNVTEAEIELPLTFKMQALADLSQQLFDLNLELSADNASILEQALSSEFSVGLRGDLSQFNFDINGHVHWLDMSDEPLWLTIENQVSALTEINSYLGLQNGDNALVLDSIWSIDNPFVLDMILNMEMPALAQVYPNIAGVLMGDIELRGDLLNPFVRADIAADHLSAFDLELESFQLKSDYENHQGAGMLKARNMRFQEFYLASLSLNLAGGLQEAFELEFLLDNFVKFEVPTNTLRIGSHQEREFTAQQQENVLRAAIERNEASLLVNNIRYRAQGALDSLRFDLSLKSPMADLKSEGVAVVDPALKNPSLNLYLASSAIESAVMGRFALYKPAHFYLNMMTQEMKLTPLCYQQRDSSLCMEGARDQGGINTAVFMVNNFSLAPLDPYLPPELSVNTRAQATIAGQFTAVDDFVGIANLSLTKGDLRYHFQGKKLLIPLETTELEVVAKPDGVVGSLNIDWGRYFQANGSGALRALFTENLIEANVRADLLDIAWITPLLPDVKGLSADIALTAGARGSLEAPLLAANLSIRNGQAYIAPLNNYLTNIHLNVGLREGTPEFHIDGGFNTKKGALRINGDYNIANFNTMISISGKNILLADSDELRAIITPKLTFTGTESVQGSRYALTGNIEIPELFYRHSTYNSGRRPVVTVSSDTIIIDGQEQALHQNFMDHLTMDVGVTLGPEIEVGIEGLKVSLEGQVNVIKSEGGPIRGLGSINIGEGELDIYGRAFMVDRGRVQFLGLPFDQAALDIQVSRRFMNWASGREDRVGVIVLGTVRNPRLRLYSSPQIEDIAIISYLVLGRLPNLGSQIEYLMLLNTLQRVARGESILDMNLGNAHQMGRNDVGIIETPDGNLGVGISRYLAESFYVGVGAGLEGGESPFLIARYYFLKKFSVNSAVSSDSLELNLNYLKDF